MTEFDNIRKLFVKYMEGTISAEERQELSDLLETYSNTEWETILEPIAENTLPEASFNLQQWETRIQYILQQPPETKSVVVSMKWKWVAAAAVVILAISTFWLIDRGRQTSKPSIAVTRKANDVLPGHNGAVLTLSNGKQVVLDSTHGNISSEGGVAVTNKDGIVSYDQSKLAMAEVVYNTVTTPNGRQYELELADGSKVFLNAESSIKFPTAFTGKDRVVEITGEAYFEVAHNAAKPFIVSVNDMQVEVLGTHFNINAYPDEQAMKTTLLEGKVRVTRNGNIALLKPGQQAVASTNTLTINPTPDLDKIMAWKDNRFYFEDDDIKTIMRQLARWYNIDVVYDDDLSNQYTGIISRNVPISKVLELFEKIGDIKFSIDGKTIHVQKTSGK